MSDLVKKADGFRLSVDPTPDDVNEANWLIDRLTAKLKDAEDERDHACNAADREETRAEAAEVREQDAYERGFKAALEEVVNKADNKAIDGSLSDYPYDRGWRRSAILIAEAIRAIPLPDTKGDDNETE